MLANWFKQRRLNKHIAAFSQLLRANDTAAALDLYDAQLEPEKAALSRELRAAYHLARWFSGRKAEDAEALRLLTTGAPVGSQLAATREVLQRLQRESSLASALRQCNAALLGEPASAKAHRQSETLEALALALLETCPAAQAGLDEGGRRLSAQTVLRLLPAAAELPDEATRKMRAHLLVWAAHTLDRHHLITAEPDIFAAFPGERRKDLQLAVAFNASRTALCAGRSGEALRAFKVVTELVDATTRRRLALAAGREAIERGAGEAAVDWFIELRSGAAAAVAADDPPDWQDVMALALGLAQLGSGQHAAAREILVPPGQDSAAAQSSPTVNGHGQIGTQRLHLATLSWLAGTADWAVPARPLDDPSAPAEDREIVVQNRALWHGVRTQLEPLLARLAAENPAALAWQGHLLAGLLAYVDRNTAFAPHQLAQFATAIEHVPDAAARTRLKNMEGALVSRAQATEEATRLVRRKDYARLRELHDTVLVSLGDTIPTLVRAAVYLTLWQGGPADYDPLPDLQRLPRDESDEAQVNECVRQVQIAQILRKLSAECTTAGADDAAERVLPPLAPLFEFNEGVALRGALAVALIHLRRGHLAAARDALPAAPHEQDRQSHAYASFYLAWQQGEVQACRALLAAEGAAHPLLARYAGHADAFSARAIVQALETDQDELLLRLFLELGGGGADAESLPSVLLRLVLWLCERGQPQQAQTLLQTIWRPYLSGQPDSLRELEHLNWVYLILSALVAAQLGQYSACIEAVNRLLLCRVPPRTVFGAADANDRVLAWLRFFRLVAELALAAGAEDVGANRWRAVQRTFAAQSADLEREPGVQPFIFLIDGLLASLSTDMVIDDALIARLVYARQALDLRARAGFIDGVIGHLTWRQQVIAQFWGALRTGDFKQGRTIYQEELLPAFGERMPHPLQLGMILATWGAGASSAADLLHRLDVLEHEAPDLDAHFIATVRNHIQDGEKYRRLVAHLEQQQFDELIALIDHTEWIGFEPGSMPIAVAITLLYAYYKTKRNEAAVEMGYRMTQTTRLSQWVQDYGALILGYVLFDEEKYATVETGEDAQLMGGPQPLNAAEVFAQISQAEIIGHNVDKYWAAAHFNQGLQLLAVNQRVKAFDAFARSLGQRGGSKHTNLAPLFLHFGLQNLELGNGNRAKQSFALMRQSLVSAPDFSAPKNQYLALLGLPPEASEEEVEKRDAEYLRDAKRVSKEARKFLKDQLNDHLITQQEFEDKRAPLEDEREQKERRLNELRARFRDAQDAEDEYTRDLNNLNEELRTEYLTRQEYDARVRQLEEQYALQYQGGGEGERLLYLLLADTGQLICETLMGEGESDPGGEAFLYLLSRIEGVPEVLLARAQGETIDVRPFLERDLRLLAICKELRKLHGEAARGGPIKAREREKLHRFLTEQIEALELLMGESSQQDVALLALKAVCELRLRAKPDSKAALDLIDQALRLGAASDKLLDLRDEQQKKMKAAQATSAEVFDLFDQYLADGAIPLDLRARLVREDNLAELYRLSRTYTPRDIMAADTQHGIPVVRQQLEHLHKFITDEKLEDDARLRPVKDKLQALIKQLTTLEEQTQACQQEVMSLLSEKLRAQSVG